VRILICVSLLAISALSNHAQTPTKLDLVGHVLSPQGKPAAAIVLIPFVQTQPASQEAYFGHFPKLPDRTYTDSEGNFRIASLDPTWRYHMVIVAAHCQPKIIDRVDPTAGPLHVQLNAINTASAPPATIMRGMVVDASGTPVPGALIKINGVTRNGSMRWPASEIDFYSASDEAGMFVVSGQLPFTAAEGSVEATNLATRLFEGWEPGDTVHKLTLTDGAAVKGRLLDAGLPVANVNIRLDNFGAESGSTAWNYSAVTDNQGRFSFAHLPPNRKFNLYAPMESLGDRGALSKHLGQVHEDGSTNDLGDLNLEPAFIVAGRIHLTDGKPIPSHSRVTLARASFVGMQDDLSTSVGPDGNFHFAGVPAEKAAIFLRIPGYEISPKDRSLKSGSATNFTVGSNLTGMLIQMQPISRW
jgi:uncharacterized GH25 family protein